MLTDYIYPAIQKEYVNIITAETEVIADAGVEAVHQLRVSLRRLRSQVSAFGMMLDIPKVMNDKHIGKIARTLGKVRDLDVLQDNLKKYGANLPESERSPLEKVAAAIGKRHRKEICKVRLMFDERDYQFFKLGINNWLNHPQYQPNAKAECDSILPDLMSSVAGGLLLHPAWWIDLEADGGTIPESAVAQALHLHGDCFHDLRKQVKAMRYLMEIFADRYPPAYLDYLKEFKQIHQIFGHVQDNVVLDKFMCKVVGKHAATKMPTVYEQIARKNCLNWERWQPIRDRYRHTATKRSFKLLLLGEM